MLRKLLESSPVYPPYLVLLMLDSSVSAAGGRYEEVVRLQETLCKLKGQFQKLQLTDVDKDQKQQRALYNGASEV